MARTNSVRGPDEVGVQSIETLPPRMDGVSGFVAGSDQPHRNDFVSGDDDSVNRPVWPTEPLVCPSLYTSAVTVGTSGGVISTCHSQLPGMLVTSEVRYGLCDGESSDWLRNV